MAVKAKTVGLTKKRRLEELQNFVALCFSMLEEFDDKELSNLTGLSLSTIRRLYLGRYTLAVQYRSIQAISAVAGIELVSSDPNKVDSRLYPYAVRIVNK